MKDSIGNCQSEVFLYLGQVVDSFAASTVSQSGPLIYIVFGTFTYIDCWCRKVGYCLAGALDNHFVIPSSFYCLVPGEWMVTVNREASSGGQTPVTPTAEEIALSKEKDKDDKNIKDTQAKAGPSEPKGDPEMSPIYLRRLLPIFTQVYQCTMLLSVRYVPPRAG